MRTVIYFLAFMLIAQIAHSQIQDDATFLTIGNQKVSTAEFERIYNKNNNIATSDKQSVEEYLQMFINFKLKVNAATDAGLDTLRSFRTELKGYRDQLAKSYMVDNKAVDSLVMEAYQRLHTEVSASHIMVALKMNPTPEDTLQAWNKIIGIRQQLLNGESFDKLAYEMSEDPSAKNNKGYLGYFSAFQMVYPFESAAYNTRIGEVSMPVRTRFGYHLVKPLDKRPAHGEVKVAHIMVMVPQGSPDSMWVAAGKKIQDIEQKLKGGADFAALAKERSEDRGSARNGGELPAFGPGRMVPEFEDASFKLVYPGDVSEPVKTAYGWHIIKLIEKRGVPDFDKAKPDIKSKISRDERAEFGSNAFIAGLKSEYKFSENPIILAYLYQEAELKPNKKSDIKVKGTSGPKSINETVLGHGKKLNLETNPVQQKQELFQFAGHRYTLKDFITYLKNLSQPDSATDAKSFVEQSYAAYVKKSLLNFEDGQLESKYPDFRNLIQEYHDGILLFNLSDSLVWSKATKDSAGLQTFFDGHRSSYVWPDRLRATIVTCINQEVAQKALKTAKKLKTQEKIETDLIKEVCDTINIDCLQINSGKFAAGDNSMIDSISWKPGFSELKSGSSKIYFIAAYGVDRSMPKQLDETKGLVISDYQNFLEKEWVGELRKKYPVQVNEEILKQLKIKYAEKI